MHIKHYNHLKRDLGLTRPYYWGVVISDNLTTNQNGAAPRTICLKYVIKRNILVKNI